MKVLVEFEGMSIKPVKFFRGNREYEIQKINLRYERKDGGRKFLCFAVELSGSTVELILDRTDLTWTLREEI